MKTKLLITIFAIAVLTNTQPCFAFAFKYPAINKSVKLREKYNTPVIKKLEPIPTPRVNKQLSKLFGLLQTACTFIETKSREDDRSGSGPSLIERGAVYLGEKNKRVSIFFNNTKSPLLTWQASPKGLVGLVTGMVVVAAGWGFGLRNFVKAILTPKKPLESPSEKYKE